MADEALRTLVRQRADHRCEYCHIRQEQVPFVPFHVDHIIPRKHGGSTHSANLALSCMHCNLHKSSDLSGIDPEGGAITPLFRPRRDRWEEHFAFQGALTASPTPNWRGICGAQH
jgi:5-methylcytosine-specific restriction endonuclease McrA